jgi:histone deacetylase complex regulatory component SIN3
MRSGDHYSVAATQSQTFPSSSMPSGYMPPPPNINQNTSQMHLQNMANQAHLQTPSQHPMQPMNPHSIQTMNQATTHLQNIGHNHLMQGGGLSRHAKAGSGVGMGQAVHFLRKVQERFQDRPHLYATFVDMLRVYQRESRDLADLKRDVAELFAGHSDLLEAFSIFVPPPAQAPQQPSSQTTEAPSSRSGARIPDRRTAQQLVQASLRGVNSARGGHKRAAAVLGSGGVSPEADHAPPNKRVATANRPVGELEFFDKVKAHLHHNAQLYGEFLKCLNWYTLDILTKKELVTLVRGFIGRSESLFNWFKRFIQYNGDDISDTTSESSLGPSAATVTATTSASSSEGGGLSMAAPSVDAYSVDLLACRRLGSYRFLPARYSHAICSGRTPLCREVLNDNLVSCPSFASEDATFVSSKKNAHEEALFRCEDERYELDLLIDANQTTMAALSPLLHKLSLMSPSETESFTLTDSLGGTSEVIARTLIRKVYGANRADEVLDALKKQPSIALPVILKRLQQKDEEWRMAQRDWNRLWRDIHFKNYDKALDHQGVTFKSTDKKTISPKSLIQDIQVLAEEVRRKRSTADIQISSSLEEDPCQKNIPYLRDERASSLHNNNASPLAILGLYDADSIRLLSFTMTDLNVLETLLHLILYQLAVTTSFQASEKRAIESFLMHFLPTILPISLNLKQLQEENASDKKVNSSKLQDSAVGKHEAIMADGEESSGAASEQSGVEDVDKVSSQERSTERTRERENRQEALYSRLQTAQDGFSALSVTPTEMGTRIFLANDQLYVFFRLFQLAYTRLEALAQAGCRRPDTPLSHHKRHLIAAYLDQKCAATSTVPALASYPASAAASTEDGYMSSGAQGVSTLEGKSSPFMLLKSLLIRLLDGSLDQGAFEERVRLLFGPHAFRLFTFDRLLYAMTKQVAAILTDPTAEHLVALHVARQRAALPVASDSHQVSSPEESHQGAIMTPEAYRTAAHSLLAEESGIMDVYLIICESNPTKDPRDPENVHQRVNQKMHEKQNVHQPFHQNDQKGHEKPEEHQEKATEESHQKRPFSATVTFGYQRLMRAASGTTTASYLDAFRTLHRQAATLDHSQHDDNKTHGTPSFPPPLIVYRYLKHLASLPAPAILDLQQACRLCMQTARRFFTPNTEDVIIQGPDRPHAAESVQQEAEGVPVDAASSAKEEKHQEEPADKCVARFRAWLETQTERETRGQKEGPNAAEVSKRDASNAVLQGGNEAASSECQRAEDAIMRDEAGNGLTTTTLQ